MTVEPGSPDVSVEPKQDPSIGVDEWVARRPVGASTRRACAATPSGCSSALGGGRSSRSRPLFGLIIPFLTTNDFQLQVGINALLLALLALGLNISVGWAGLLDLGYIAFYGFGAYGFALLSSNQLHPPTGIHFAAYRVAADHRGGGGVPGADRRIAVAAADRRLPGDPDAVLRRGVRRVHQQRGAEHARGSERDHLDRPDPGLRPSAHDQQGLLLLRCWPARADRGRAPPARHLAHRSRLAGRPRGPAGGGDDDDPGQPGEADGVQLRRGRRRARRDRVRRAADQRVPDRLRHAVPDPDLRGADPRRRRQHRRRDPRRAAVVGDARRVPAQPDRGRLPVLRGDPADADRQDAAVAEARGRPGGDRRARPRRPRDRRGDQQVRGRRRRPRAGSAT